jgi:hypothetical protein
MKARHRLSKVIVFGAVLTIVALWGLNHVEAGTGVLDGKTFTGRTGEKGKEAKGDDELRFENGKLFSVGCAKWGFGEGVYNARVEGDRIHFEAVTLSPKHGQIVWEGTVIDDTIDATYIWTKKRWWWKDAYLEKWLKGTVKK